MKKFSSGEAYVNAGSLTVGYTGGRRCRSKIVIRGTLVRCMLETGHDGYHKQAPYYFVWRKGNAENLRGRH